VEARVRRRVAGYSFTSANARKLDEKWKAMLRRFELPYFRMSACNANMYPFDKLSAQQCIDVATEAIGLIKEFALVGYAVTVDQHAFDRIVTRNGFVSTPYEFCALLCLVSAREITHHLSSRMAYFFEAGFPHQGVANNMMNRIFTDTKEWYKYKSHSFVDKIDCRPCQAADLLAWQWYKQAKRAEQGKTVPRGDLFALLEGPQHMVLHADARILQEMVDAFCAKAGSPLGNEIAGLCMRNPKHPIFPKRPGESGSVEAYERLKAQYPERFQDT
jgi:hypothetical protein